MKKIKKYTISTIPIALIILFSGCKKAKTFLNADGVVWHTTYHITYSADADLSGAIMQAMDSVERSLSPFLDSSLISLINRNESDSIDRRISTVFEKSQQINRASRGAFDPTVAPLVNLWGFGYTGPADRPDQSMIDSCMTSVGISDCRIEGNRIIKKSPATEFNFSAITKGFGCDEVARTLRLGGCRDYMVEIGGEIAVAGKSPRGDKWKIMVDAPVDSTPGASGGVATLSVSDCGIATSGNYRNYRDTADGRIGHTISPATGYPVTTEILSATVIAPTVMEADALATAAMAMTIDDALEMFAALGSQTGAMLIVKDGDGDNWKIIKTDSFDTLTK